MIITPDWDSDVVQAINNESGADKRSAYIVLARLLAAYLAMPRHVSAMITISRDSTRPDPRTKQNTRPRSLGASTSYPGAGATP